MVATPTQIQLFGSCQLSHIQHSFCSHNINLVICQQLEVSTQNKAYSA